MATTVAVAMGLAAGKMFNPGSGLDEDVKQEMLTDYAGLTPEQLETVTEKPNVLEILVRIIPRNPIKAMADTDFLQTNTRNNCPMRTRLTELLGIEKAEK